jgi:membrane fusion protein, multidrug efflux system
MRSINILYAISILLALVLLKDPLSKVLFKEKADSKVLLPDLYMPINLTVSGTISNRNFVQLKSETRGQIKSINPNLVCKKGDIIVELESGVQEGLYTKTKALVDKAENALKRLESRKKNGGNVSDSEIIDATSELQAALGECKRAKSELEKMTILAPFDGKIGIYKFSVGAIVMENQEIAALASENDLTLDFSVSELNLNDIYEGKKIYVILPSDNLIKEAIIEKVDVTADAVHSINIRGALLSDQGDNSKIKVGCSVKIKIPLNESATELKKLSVKETAILSVYGSEYIYILRDSYAERVPVTLGTRNNGYVEVQGNGIKENDQYVDKIAGRFIDGRKILPEEIK